MKRTSLRILTGFLCLLMTAALVSACGKKVTVTVTDRNTKTEIEVSAGKTISEILTEAGITLGEKDEADPSADSKLGEDTAVITVKRYAKVSFIDGDTTTEAEVTGGTVGDAMKAAGITLGENDSIDASESYWAEDGMTVNVFHKAVITVVDSGKSQQAVTDAKTVDELLKELNLTLGDEDTVSPEVSAEISSGDTVTITRVTYEEKKETEEIMFESAIEYSDSMPLNEKEVTTPGVNGVKEVTYRIKMVDGKEESREVVSEVVTVEPVTEVTTIGTYEESVYDDSDDYDDSGDYGDSGDYDDSGDDGGVYELYRVAVPGCADGSHGYYEIYYSDGSVEYEVY